MLKCRVQTHSLVLSSLETTSELCPLPPCRCNENSSHVSAQEDSSRKYSFFTTRAAKPAQTKIKSLAEVNGQVFRPCRAPLKPWVFLRSFFIIFNSCFEAMGFSNFLLRAILIAADVTNST